MPPNLVILRFYRIFAAEIKEIQNERIQKELQINYWNTDSKKLEPY